MKRGNNNGKGSQNFRGNGRGRRKPNNQSKGKDRNCSKEEEVFNNAEGTNDPMWYALNGQLLSDSASFSFNIPLGSKLRGVTNDDNFRLPGVMALYMSPAIGISTSGESPINIAARNIYSYVRHANSGHSNYDVPDLMMYLLAMDSLYSMHAFLIRLYGVANTFSQVNRYLPKTVITSMGICYEDVIENLADLRYYINNMAVKISSMATPASMPYFARHMWLYTNIYTDGPTAKSQIYLYTPDNFYQYAPFESEKGGQLEPVYIDQCSKYSSNGLVQLRGLLKLADNMINAVVTDEDMGIMSGDILKAFGAEKLVKVITIPADYSVLPSFNMEVLTQIQNTVPIMRAEEQSSVISQSGGAILFNPTFELLVNAEDPLRLNPLNKAYKYMFNMPMDSPTPADVMVASRNTVRLTQEIVSGDWRKFNLDSCGSEYCTYINIAEYADDKPGKVGALGVRGANAYGSLKKQLEVISTMDKFNMHPTYIVGSSATEWVVLGDMSNFTLMSADDLKKMHETALLSEFDVPQMGAYSMSRG